MCTLTSNGTLVLTLSKGIGGLLFSSTAATMVCSRGQRVLIRTQMMHGSNGYGSAMLWNQVDCTSAAAPLPFSYNEKASESRPTAANIS
jgi:hypothetical protein